MHQQETPYVTTYDVAPLDLWTRVKVEGARVLDFITWPCRWLVGMILDILQPELMAEMRDVALIVRRVVELAVANVQDEDCRDYSTCVEAQVARLSARERRLVWGYAILGGFHATFALWHDALALALRRRAGINEADNNPSGGEHE